MRRESFGLMVALFLVMAVTFVSAEPVVKEIYYSKVTTLRMGTFTLKFSLWDDDIDGNLLWEEEKAITLAFADRRTLTTYLGEVNPLDGVDFSQQLWVQVENKNADGSYTQIGFRDMLGVVPYALYSNSGTPGPQGPEGPQGPAGPQGPEGPAGNFDLNKRYVRSISSGSPTTVLTVDYVECDSTADRVAGGGGACHKDGGYFVGSYPTTVDNKDRWVVLCQDGLGSSWYPTQVYVICLTP